MKTFISLDGYIFCAFQKSFQKLPEEVYSFWQLLSMGCAVHCSTMNYFYENN
jgi:hypothetical protein